jgi:hypothetical protein
VTVSTPATLPMPAARADLGGTVRILSTPGQGTEAIRLAGTVRPDMVVLDLLSYAQIAERLVLSRRTVQNHVQHTLSKLQLHNRAQLVRYVIERGLDEQPG